MTFALAQIDPTVGDIKGNVRRILAECDQARRSGADVVIFPELCVFGYPPRDAVYRAELVERNLRAVEEIARRTADLTVVLGHVGINRTGTGRPLLNAASVCTGGTVRARYAKSLLPTYDVFDEARYFEPGRETVVVDVRVNGTPVRLGITICEDLWNDAQFEGRKVYGQDPVKRTVEAGADVVVNLSASPFRSGVWRGRESLFCSQMTAHRRPLLYVNQVGGNDDVLFDGASLAIDAAGTVAARAKAFEEDLLIVHWPIGSGLRVEPYPEELESIREALAMGIRDYVHKCGFTSVLVGVSGGIDSAVTTALAVEALGAEHVRAVALPSRFSSAHSLEDARALADNLGVRLTVMDIEPVHRAVEETLAPVFAEAGATTPTVAEENVQARIRGLLLMALSNKFGALLLSTGNKSEWAVGYCTLYGDMCGALAVLSDVPKTTVFALARHINEHAGRVLIPEHTISKPPSAELREHQTDQDTLPPYDLLDAILERYVTHGERIDRIIEAGLDADTVRRVARMVARSEYKRKQAPVGLKVTSRAFGTGWRMPIAARLETDPRNDV